MIFSLLVLLVLISSCATDSGMQAEAGVSATTEQPAVEEAPAPVTNWREDFAYTLGMHAYIFGFPFARFEKLRYEYPWVQATPEAHDPVNQFWHQRTQTTHESKSGGSPNADLLYSVTAFEVKNEPVILSVPPVPNGRYYTFEMISMDSDNFAYVGTRTTGNNGGNYAIVGPDWNGTLPADVVALPPSRTPYGLIYGRTWIENEEELPEVTALQDKYTLTPLSQWLNPNAPAPKYDTPWEPLDPKNDPLAVWKNINRAMEENPPGSRYAALMGQYARIGVGPGQDVENMDEDTKRGLMRAAKDAHALIIKTFRQGPGTYPEHVTGRSTEGDDYLFRAVTALIGNGINDREESVYLIIKNESGKPYNSANNYTLRIPPKQIPEYFPGGYWSLTMYDTSSNLVENPINRYTFASIPEGNFEYDEDGGVTFYIQNESPGPDKESNWLPSPAGEQYYYILLRVYLTGEPILERTYEYPVATVN